MKSESKKLYLVSKRTEAVKDGEEEEDEMT